MDVDCLHLVQAITGAVSSSVQRSCHVQKTLFLSCPSSNLWLSCSFHPAMVAEPRGKRRDRDVPFMAEHATEPFLPFDKLWVSALTVVHCTKKIPWWALKDSLPYGYRNTTLEGIWILCPLSWIIRVGLPPGLVSSTAMYSWPNLCYQTCASSYRAGLKPKQRMIGYPYHIYATVTPMEHLATLVIVVHCVHSWARLFDSLSQQPT